jgi:hypothetical protein
MTMDDYFLNYNFNSFKQKIMKTKLLFKSLLVAAGLCVGQSAWADWTTVYSNDYTNAETYDAGWTNGNSSRIAWGQMTRTDLGESVDKTAMKIYMTNLNNGTTATFNGLSSVSAYTSSERYKIEFDFGLTTSNNQVPSFTIYAADNTTALVTFTGKTGDAASCTFTTLDEKSGTFYSAGYSYNTHSLTDGAPSVFNHVLIEADATNGTKITISGASTEEQTVVISSEMKYVGKMVWDSKKYMTAFAIDNLTVSVYSDAEIVPNPTASVTAIDGAGRTITMALGTGSKDGTVIKYYTEVDGEDNPTDLTTYVAPFSTSTATTIYYYAESTSSAKSDVQTLVTTAGTTNTLGVPTIMRTGADTYTLTATAKEIDGLAITQTLHWTIDGGSEQTGASPAYLTSVTGDIVAWATADGVTKSPDLNETYVAPFANITETWSYNLNSYPSSYTCTAITAAIDESTEATLNEITVYNLKGIDKPNLFVENTSGWLLRNQASSAWKAQSAASSIIINNVKTTDVICVNARRDGGNNSISALTNGSVAYNYNLTDYYIVPSADGAVTVTFNTGVAVNNVSVSSIIVPVTIASSGYSSIASAYALDCAHLPAGLEAYKVTDIAASAVTLEQVKEAVAPGTGLILKGTESTAYNIPVVATGSDISATNKLKAAVAPTTLADGEFYILKSGEFHKVIDTADEDARTVPAGKAYLLAADVPAAGAPALNFVFAGSETTGINAVNGSQSMVKGSQVYNLAGQRVAQPTRGLYIVNGKKVVVK